MSFDDLDWNVIDSISEKMILWAGATPENRGILALGLYRIPKKFRDYILKNCVFIIADSLRGQIFNVRYIENLVILNWHQLRGYQDYNARMKQNSVAHECAHFVLNHHRHGEVPIWQRENEADDLAESWGFDRAHSCRLREYDFIPDVNQKLFILSCDDELYMKLCNSSPAAIRRVLSNA